MKLAVRKSNLRAKISYKSPDAPKNGVNDVIRKSVGFKLVDFFRHATVNNAARFRNFIYFGENFATRCLFRHV